MELVSTTDKKVVLELVAEKKVDMAGQDEAVPNILRIKYRVGQFENPKIDLEQVTFRILCGLDVLLY